MIESPSRDDSRPPPLPPAQRGNPWAWPVMWMVCLLILAGSGVYVVRSCIKMPAETLQKGAEFAEKAGQALEKVASAFKQGRVTTTFSSYATTLSGSQYLQVATVKQTEVFTRKDEASVAFGYIPLPDIVVQATAPVTYTYYVDLNARWDFKLQDGVIYVVAPDIHFNKPAVDASLITYEVRKDSYLRRTHEAMENLKSSITYLSIERAKTNIDLAREKARKEVESFVENWLSKSFADGKQYPVKVRFKSETPFNGEAPKKD
jgi:hypothetical protein